MSPDVSHYDCLNAFALSLLFRTEGRPLEGFSHIRKSLSPLDWVLLGIRELSRGVCDCWCRFLVRRVQENEPLFAFQRKKKKRLHLSGNRAPGFEEGVLEYVTVVFLKLSAA